MSNKKPQLPDPRNSDIQVWVDDGLKPRDQACISVFDSSVQGGDAVWEGLRVYDGRIAEFDAHIDRLFDSAHAMAFANIPTRDFVENAIFTTLETNGMRDGAHMRLTLTRGKKVTSNMNPKVNQHPPCLIVLAEWKAPIYTQPVSLITSAIRRNSPQCVDSKIHHNNLINNILAAIEANVAGVDAALMLDLNGFVSETNDTNVFIVKNGVLLTPHADSCLPGITRRLIIRLGREDGIEVIEKNISLTEIYTADEMFTTGTVGELTPVACVDGRLIGAGEAGEVTPRLQGLHAGHVREHGKVLPF
jgi:branched-chain amino acid aminotransferase